METIATLDFYFLSAGQIGLSGKYRNKGERSVEIVMLLLAYKVGFGFVLNPRALNFQRPPKTLLDLKPSTRRLSRLLLVGLGFHVAL